MTVTNTMPGTPDQPLRLEELSAILMRREKIAYGLFLSKALWDAISKRFVEEGSNPLAAIPHTFHGVRTALDPSLPPTEFSVAFTADAWHKRLRELGQPTSSGQGT